MTVRDLIELICDIALNSKYVKHKNYKYRISSSITSLVIEISKQTNQFDPLLTNTSIIRLNVFNGEFKNIQINTGYSMVIPLELDKTKECNHLHALLNDITTKYYQEIPKYTFYESCLTRVLKDIDLQNYPLLYQIHSKLLTKELLTRD